MKNLQKYLGTPMQPQQMKYTMIAFWVTTAFALMTKVIMTGTPCAMCMIQSTLAFVVAAHCFIVKWFSKLLGLTMLATSAWILAGLYHLSMVLHILPSPKFCKLNATFMEKTLSACSDANPMNIAISLAFASATLWLLNKAKKA